MSEFHIDYAPICDLYAKEQPTGTLYLAFRDIPTLLTAYLKTDKKIKALDFGCGTGVSTRFLKSLSKLFEKGIEVEGVDINHDVLKLAIQADPNGVYYQIQNGKISAPDQTYDLIFSTFVLFEFATLKKMQEALEEIKRVMKKGGIFIAVTGSIETYDRKNRWVCLNGDFLQNEHLKSGSLGRIDYYLNNDKITFENYYWTEEDYRQAFQQAGLHILETLHPLGFKNEEKHLSWQWKSETSVSPYYIFVSTSFSN